jgi:hypothetical protein
VAIINSFTSSQKGRTCRESILSADFIAARDLEMPHTYPLNPHAILAPDSAVMIPTLFKDEIARHANSLELSQIIGSGDYIVVQMLKDFNRTTIQPHK